MNAHQKRVKVLARIVIAVLMTAGMSFVPVDGALRLVLYLVPYLAAGYDVLLEALEGIREREIFDECFLMAVATIGALVLGEYSEACAVMILYQVGEMFGDYASDRSRETIASLMDIRPDYANVEREGVIERVSPSGVEKGSVILVRPGEKIPIDGVILEGHSAIDTKALTGESLPKDVAEGEEVLSGCVNMSAVLRVRTTREFSDSAVSKILALVEHSQSRKAKAEKFITKFARVYTPAVCACALLLVIVPALINPQDFSVWLYRALTFLVISCPCALVISIPLAFFCAVGGAGRAGILVKGGNFLESLAKVSCFAFDKTGTLTRGVFEVVAVHPEIRDENSLLHLAAHVEQYSLHPAAEALRRAFPLEGKEDSCVVSDVEEIAGLGVRAKVNGEVVCVGSSRLMEEAGASWHPCTKSSGTVIHIAIDGVYAGHVVISDVVKPSSREAVRALKCEGVGRIAMLTGDTEASAREAAKSVGIDEVYSELLPGDKAAKVEEFARSGVTAFVGDGLNDAPVLALADVGVAMGALGSDAAIEAADVVIMNDDPLKAALAVKISRKCMRIVKQNIAFSIGVKVLCMVLGAVGLAGMWGAVFADVGVMVLAVINSVRAMFTDKG